MRIHTVDRWRYCLTARRMTSFDCVLRQAPFHKEAYMMDDVYPASLLDEIDKKIMVWLRDGRTIVGILRSVDQFVNLVLSQAIERIHVGNTYGDIPRGTFVIRGENVALVGEIRLSEEPPQKLCKVSECEILRKQEVEQTEKLDKWSFLCRAYKNKGLVYNPADGSLELLM